MRAGAAACADSQTAALVDRDNATAPAKKRRVNLMPNS
jgi:hypothetical protein